MTDEQFMEAVNSDVRGTKNPVLREESELVKWRQCLLSLKRSCETQLADDKALRSEEQAKHGELSAEFLAIRNRWRAGTIRFMNGIENRLAECNALIAKLDSYEEAILNHYESIMDGEDEDSADRTLWRKVGINDEW